jgi:hypothetical protein
MAPIVHRIERRREARHIGGGDRWRALAMLRPGQPITLLNITSRAALVESAARLRPGAHTELQLAGPDLRASVRGRLDRCHVAALEPIRYRAVLLFEERIDIGGGLRQPNE